MASRMKWFGKCPFCGLLVELKQRKDFESFTNIEVGNHMEEAHPRKLNKFLRQNDGYYPFITQYSEDEAHELLGRR